MSRETPEIFRPAESSTPSEISAVLSQYKKIGSIVSAIPLEKGQGFSGAQIWRLTIDGQTYGLRAWPRDTVTADRLHGLHRLLAHCHAAEMREIPVPVSSDAGKTWLEHAGRLWQLEPWMPGDATFYSDPSPNRLTAAMSCLARWHLAASQFPTSPVYQAWFHTVSEGIPPGLQERMEILQSWTPRRLRDLDQILSVVPNSEIQTLGVEIMQRFLLLAPLLADELRSFAGVTVPLQPCIRDVWHDHLLFSEDEVTGLIDFGACRVDTVATDLARLLGSLVADDRVQWQRALETYERFRPLNVAESRLLAVCDHSQVALAGMTWLDWIFLQKRRFANPEVIIARLKTILTRMRHLQTIIP